MLGLLPNTTIDAVPFVCHCIGPCTYVDVAPQDLDMCRDPEVRGNLWTCDECSQPRDKLELEAQLVRYVQRLAVQYHSQDLQCVKCHGVQVSLVICALILSVRVC